MSRKPSLGLPPETIKQQPAVRPASRHGKRAIAFWVNEADYEEFRVAVVRAGTTIQSAGEEMLSDWMKQKGMKLPGR